MEQKLQLERPHAMHPVQSFKEVVQESVFPGIPTEPDNKLQFGENGGRDCAED